MVVINSPATMAVVMTPATLGPMAKGRIMAFLLALKAHFWATLAVVGNTGYTGNTDQRIDLSFAELIGDHPPCQTPQSGEQQGDTTQNQKLPDLSAQEWYRPSAERPGRNPGRRWSRRVTDRPEIPGVWGH